MVAKPTWKQHNRVQYTQVWYHHNCNDGLAAAVVASMRARSWRKEPVYVSVQYGQDPPPYRSSDRILIVDFSYKREVLDRIVAEVEWLFVIDHHKTARAELEGCDYAWFEEDYSGAMMTWFYFFPDKATPYAILYVQDRDLWRFDLTGSNAINAMLWTYPRHFSFWQELMEDMESASVRSDMAKSGQVLLDAKQRIVESTARRAVPMVLADQPVWAVNASVYFSEIAHHIAETKDPDHCVAGAVYFIRQDGKVQFSLRSLEGVDCSHIAKHYGGGGHAQACGFETDQQTLLELLRGEQDD